MLDFDELEEAAPVPEAPPEYRGGFLRHVKRSERLPGLQSHLPEKLRGVFTDLAQRKVRIRLFLFYGAGDSFVSWAQFVVDAPDWVDVVVYEWPSHGLRQDEPPPEALDDLADDASEALEPVLKEHAFGGKFAGAPFALAGHSIGARLMSLVAMRARTRLGVEPKMVIAMDFPPLHVPMLSEEGMRLLREDTGAYMELNNPTVFKASKALEDGRRVLQMWQSDLKLANDTRPVGSFLFRCGVIVLVAARNFYGAFLPENAEPEHRDWHARRSSISASRPENSADFDRSAYDEWAQWTKVGCEVREFDADHMSIKSNRDAAAFIYERLKLVRHNLEIGGSMEVS